MEDDLEVLIRAAAQAAWKNEPARQLAEAIEHRIVLPLPLWLKTNLGRDEASQLARVIAWERCHELAVKPPRAGISWGYLANHVRWRLIDAVRAEVVRRQRHPVTHPVPDVETPEVPMLGAHLDRIVAELEQHGLPSAVGRELMRVAADGPPFYRSTIISRLRLSGVTESQAEALAWLVRGSPSRPSALARLAAGQPDTQVFEDLTVRKWLKAAAGRDLRFFGRWTSEYSGRDLARSA
ncbi:hypothetical protein [Kribbella sp. CA-293567]|uniref:hypothetical protein n=1 Tax=Kribbella sp. CA-293567 TaxID=3002436 RepID=UPI0022DD3820|nr:hypothetical protein [Kribbella sp. CA-293567]WBQ04409.1 hypothetical protein OX958_31155 [Kribbella sp. CA-293567]